MKRVLSSLIKVGVTAGLFTLLFWPEVFGLSPDIFGGVKPRDMLRELQGAGAANVALWLGFALAVKLFAVLCGVMRWRLLLYGQGLRMPLRYVFESFFVGRMFGIFMPGTIGLDGYRIYDSSRYTGEVIKCTTVIVVEKLTGFVALTGLVFLTFPLGMQVVNIKLPFLLTVMGILGVFVVVFFLLLLNPRVIQVLLAVLPTPAIVRNPINKLAAAATAYSGSRMNLLLAVLLGVIVHLGTCLMFFGTAMSIRAENVDLAHILFASPLVIYGTVLGPSIGGEGIREFGFLALLATGAGATAAAAVTLAHLGWWVGEVVPFLIGAVVFVLRKRPEREELEAHVAEARKEAAAAQAAALAALHLSPEAVRGYRANVFGMLTCGVFAGAYAGAVLGVCESAWLYYRLGDFSETGMFWWGAIAYSVVFAGIGFGVAAALLFLCLLVDVFPRWFASFGVIFGSSLGLAALGLGVWRFQRDLLAGHFPSKLQLAFAGQLSAGVVLEGFVIAAIAAIIVGRIVRHRAVWLMLVGILGYAGLIGAAYAASVVTRPQPAVQAAFKAMPGVAGPNVIFVGLDACRADYLRLFEAHPGEDNTALFAAEMPAGSVPAPLDEPVLAEGNTVELPAAAAGLTPVTQQPVNPYRSPSVATPALESFARDAVVFDHAFAQASWTKPSFATIFTGMYPEQHGATNKDKGIPEDANTLAERLRAAGYYTQGYPNNPWLSSLYNFDQGYVGYEFLEPARIYGAPASAANLAIYGVLHRMVKPRVDKLLRHKMNVRQFYHPAEDVTAAALQFLESGAVPDGAPFFLYLHYMDTHDPFMDPDAPNGGYARANMDAPDPSLDKALEKAYVLEIQHMDRYLGELFEGLKRLGVYENTLIVVTGDHGEEFYDHGGWWHGQTLYDELVHIPLLVKLPGNHLGGTRNSDLARHIDLAPTMLQFAGLPKSPAMAGQALFDAQGNFANAGIHSAHAHNDFEGNVIRAVRTRDTKLIQTEEGQKYYRGIPPVELYDLQANPDERWDANLAHDPAHAGVRQTLEQSMGAHAQEPAGAPRAAAAAPEPPTAAPDAIPQQMQDQLGALGYVE